MILTKDELMERCRLAVPGVSASLLEDIFDTVTHMDLRAAAAEHELDKANDQVKALQEELTSVLADWNGLVKAIGSPTNGGAVGHAKSVIARVQALEAALTPSATTKAALSGEFEVACYESSGNSPHDIPWTTIKDIMKAIKGLADARRGEQIGQLLSAGWRPIATAPLDCPVQIAFLEYGVGPRYLTATAQYCDGLWLTAPNDRDAYFHPDYWQPCPDTSTLRPPTGENGRAADA